jgi:hypothetical protein
MNTLHIANAPRLLCIATLPQRMTSSWRFLRPATRSAQWIWRWPRHNGGRTIRANNSWRIRRFREWFRRSYFAHRLAELPIGLHCQRIESPQHPDGTTAFSAHMHSAETSYA